MSFKYIKEFLTVLVTLSVVNSKVINYIDSNGILYNVTEFNATADSDNWVSWAQFDNSINKTGWAQLEIHSNAIINDSLQAYSNGLIEGYLTADLIEFHWNNNIEHYCDNATEYCDKLFAFITANIEFTKTQIEKYGQTDPYWHQIELSLLQLIGLEDGYKAVKNGITPLGPRLDVNVRGLILMNLKEEFGELEQVLGRKGKNIDLSDGRCSAIVRVLADGTDLFVAHNSWTSYATMLRVLKKYDFNYNNISGKSIAFSSYPGNIFSIDDYYLISNGLVVLETSIGNYNKSLWQNVVADRVVFEFIRNTVANRLARTGRQWTEIFSKYNSGTYNNQFMIVDYNKFERGVDPSNLSDGLLWILEQMPGYVESGDATQVLRQQLYWPSYNIPYFKSIYDISDQNSQYVKFGDFYNYNQTARALIFKRDHKKAIDLPTLYQLMRYNDFQNDPLSRCNCTPPYTAEYAIAARCDLNDPKGHYPFSTLGFRSHGAIDVKLTNVELFAKQQMIATSSPSYERLPAFQWSNTRIVGVPHTGQPDLFRFPPVRVQWSPSSQTVVQFAFN